MAQIYSRELGCTAIEIGSEANDILLPDRPIQVVRKMMLPFSLEPSEVHMASEDSSPPDSTYEGEAVDAELTKEKRD